MRHLECGLVCVAIFLLGGCEGGYSYSYAWSSSGTEAAAQQARAYAIQQQLELERMQLAAAYPVYQQPYVEYQPAYHVERHVRVEASFPKPRKKVHVSRRKKEDCESDVPTHRGRRIR